MERVTTAEQDINSPGFYDQKFNGTLGVFDMERHEKLAKHFKGGVYVDLGCFDSIMPIIISERFPKAEVYALDYAPKLIAFMAQRFPKVKYQVADVMSLPFKDESVDYVCAGEVIEHLGDPEGFVKEVMRVLKPGGYFALSTPFEEQHKHIGGNAHLWKWKLSDIEELLETKEVEVLQEQTNKTILAWRKK